MSFLYLASPYSHNNPSVVEARFRAVRAATAGCIQRGLVVFSPIVHCHDLTQEYGFPSDAKHWRGYNEAMLGAAAGLIVLTIAGWRTSQGVAWEVEFAQRHALPVQYLDEKGTLTDAPAR